MKIAISGVVIFIVLIVAVMWLKHQYAHNLSFYKSQGNKAPNEYNNPMLHNGPKMEKYEYFCSDGGPFILITSNIRARWRGVANMFNPLDPKTDYGKACRAILGVENNFGIMKAPTGEVLVVDAPMLAIDPTKEGEGLEIYLLKELKSPDLDSMIEQCQKELSDETFEITGKTVEFVTDEVTFMYAGDVYGECMYGFSDFKLKKGKYDLLKFEWGNQKLGKIVVLKLTGKI